MRRKPVGILLAVTVALLALNGCAFGGNSGSDPNDPDQVEAITWWASGAEKLALYDLVAQFTTANPEIDFIDASVRGADGVAAQAAIAARLDADNPPDTFQAGTGAALTDYVADGRLQDLTEFFAQNGLTDAYRADLLESISVDGKIYSVPVAIHRVNVLWSNSALLRAAGVDPAGSPADIDAWLADLETLRRSGVEYPLALGDAAAQVQLFENVLVADLGATVYRDLWTDIGSWDGAILRTPIAHYGALLEYADPASRFDDSVEAVQTVVVGDAAYLVMADSALAAFERAGFTSGSQYAAVPSPGTAGVFDFTADSFTLPVGAIHDRAARAWMLTVGSATGQQALSQATGSIPARLDTATEDYPPYQQGAIASLQVDTVVPSIAFGVAASPGWTQAIADAVVKFGTDGHPEALVNALIARAEDELTT